MNPWPIIIWTVVGGAVLGDIMKAFRCTFIDVVVVVALWLGGGILLLLKVTPAEHEQWIERRSEGESAALLFGPALIIAVIFWYLVNWNSGPFSRMNGLSAFVVLTFYATPLGLAFSTLIAPKIWPDNPDAANPDVTVMPPARPMAPADYGGNVIDFSAAKQAADTGDFDFDPARFGKTGTIQPPEPAPVPPPDQTPCIPAPIENPTGGRLIVDMGFTQVYELGPDRFLVIEKGKRDAIMNRRKFSGKTGCCIDDLRGHWSFGRDMEAVKRKNLEREQRLRPTCR